MDISSIIGFVGAIKDDERRADAVRRLVLNEAYFNLGLLGVIDARCVARKTRDRNRLIRRLRSDSRTAHDLFSVEKGTASRIRDRILDWIDGPRQSQSADFQDWTASEVYHFCLTKIDVLKAVVESELESEGGLLLARRLRNIRVGLLALVGKLRA